MWSLWLVGVISEHVWGQWMWSLWLVRVIRACVGTVDVVTMVSTCDQ